MAALSAPPAEARRSLLEYRSLAAAVSDWIASRIVSGELPAGARLTEVELAQRLNVSRSPVREALQRLSGEGLIELTPRRGAQVARLDAEDARGLYECRLVLEPACTRLAVEAISSEGIHALDDVLARMGPAIAAHEYELFLRLNVQYHRTLIHSCPNRVLRELVELTWSRSERYWRLLRLVRADHMEGSYRYHHDLHGTVKAQNAAAAEALMRSLLGYALKQILNYFPQRDQHDTAVMPAGQSAHG